MWVRSLAQKDSLEKVWQPTSVFLPGESHGHMSLAGSSPCIVKLSSIPFSEWPGNTGLGTRGSHIQAFGTRRSAKRALREPQ